MDYIDRVMRDVTSQNKDKPLFIAKLKETYSTLIPYIEKNPRIKEKAILERLACPERTIMFSVPWLDDSGKIQINKGYRVQYNSACGTYKGGIRFTPDLNLDVLTALAFEQTFKNSLTGIALGGAKGGSDFNPCGRSDNEIMNFCRSFMTEFYRYIGPYTDVPAGDIGVGKREIGYLFGTYKRIMNASSGIITGKDVSCGGIIKRLPATGYGVCYAGNKLMDLMRHDSFKGKRIIVSGCGKVGLYVVLKATELGGKVVGINDLSGCCRNEKGINPLLLKEIKEEGGNVYMYSLKDGDSSFNKDFHALWDIPCDIVIPCATQNELDMTSVKKLISTGASAFIEGANMPIAPDAVKYIIDKKLIYLPGKVANAGGVIVSSLEMHQNACFRNLKENDVESELKSRLEKTVLDVRNSAESYNQPFNTLLGANILAFERIATAMLNQGI